MGKTIGVSTFYENVEATGLQYDLWIKHYSKCVDQVCICLPNSFDRTVELVTRECRKYNNVKIVRWEKDDNGDHIFQKEAKRKALLGLETDVCGNVDGDEYFKEEDIPIIKKWVLSYPSSCYHSGNHRHFIGSPMYEWDVGPNGRTTWGHRRSDLVLPGPEADSAAIVYKGYRTKKGENWFKIPVYTYHYTGCKPLQKLHYKWRQQALRYGGKNKEALVEHLRVNAEKGIELTMGEIEKVVRKHDESGRVVRWDKTKQPKIVEDNIERFTFFEIPDNIITKEKSRNAVL